MGLKLDDKYKVGGVKFWKPDVEGSEISIIVIGEEETQYGEGIKGIDLDTGDVVMIPLSAALKSMWDRTAKERLSGLVVRYTGMVKSPTTKRMYKNFEIAYYPAGDEALQEYYKKFYSILKRFFLETELAAVMDEYEL